MKDESEEDIQENDKKHNLTILQFLIILLTVTSIYRCLISKPQINMTCYGVYGVETICPHCEKSFKANPDDFIVINDETGETFVFSFDEILKKGDNNEM